MSPYIWIIITNSYFPDFDDLLQTYIPYNCKFVIIHSKDGFSYKILQAYKVKIISNMTIKVFGEWDAENGFTWYDWPTEPDFQNEGLLITANRNVSCRIPNSTPEFFRNMNNINAVHTTYLN